MKLYAIVIGRKKTHKRYITFHHLRTDAITSETPLAVYKDYQVARKVRKSILEDIGHKDVFIKSFEVNLDGGGRMKNQSNAR